jgi:hypothetical protein
MRIHLVAVMAIVCCLTPMSPIRCTVCASEPGLNPRLQAARRQQSLLSATEDLIVVLRDSKLQKSDPERVTSAIRLLGERKSVLAIDDLINLLTFRPPNPSEK